MLKTRPLSWQKAILFSVILISFAPFISSELAYGAEQNALKFYVDIQQGSDDQGDGFKGNPWKTLHYAISSGLPSKGCSDYTPCELILLPGEYSIGTGEQDTALTVATPNVTISCVEPSQCLIKNQGNAYWNTALMIATSNVTVKNIKFQGFDTAILVFGSSTQDVQISYCDIIVPDTSINAIGVYISGSANVEVDNAKIYVGSPFGTAIYVDQGTLAKLYRSYIELTAQYSDAIWFSGVTGDCTIGSNTILASEQESIHYGVYLDPSSSAAKATIVNNVFQGLTNGIIGYWPMTVIYNDFIENHQAILLAAPAQSIIHNNIFYGNEVGIEQVGNWGYIDINYNCAWANTVDYSNVTVGEGSVNQDPLFISTSDFHLTFGSPCIDAASTAYTVDEDREGNFRPSRNGYDIGAYEYQNEAPVILSTTTTQIPDSDPYTNYLTVTIKGKDTEGDEVSLLNAFLESDPSTCTTPTITPITATSWKFSATEKDYTFTVAVGKDQWMESCNYRLYLILEDQYGAQGSDESDIISLDFSPPAAQVNYSPTQQTAGNVIACVTASENFSVLNNSGSKCYTFSDNGNFIFEIVDDFRNYTQVLATVNWIVHPEPWIKPPPYVPPYAVVSGPYVLDLKIGDDLTACDSLEVTATKGQIQKVGCDVKLVWFPLPNELGNNKLKVIVTDTDNNQATFEVDITVVKPLIVDPSSLVIVRVNNKDYEKTFLISGGMAQNAYSITVMNAQTEEVEYTQTATVFTLNNQKVANFLFDSKGYSNGLHYLMIQDEAGIGMQVPINIIDVPGQALGLSNSQLQPNLDTLSVINDTNSSYNGAKIFVPSGSLEQPITLTVTKITDIQNLPMPKSTTLKDVIEIDALGYPVDVYFKKAVEIEVPYGTIVGITAPENLRVYRFHENLGFWRPLETKELDKANKTITVKTDHFSLFSLMEAKAFTTSIKGGKYVEDYVMMSFPCISDAGSITQALSPSLGDYTDTVWRAFVWNSEAQDYVEADKLLSDLILGPGHTFWLISAQTKPISITGLPVKDFQGKLAPGWNMAGNPFEEDLSPSNFDMLVSTDGITWEDMTSSSLIAQYLWEFSPQQTSSGTQWYKALPLASTAMAPYKGYWMYNKHTGPLFVKITPKALTSSQGLQRKLYLAFEGLKGFFSQLVATAFAGSDAILTPPAPPFAIATSPNSIGVTSAGAGGGGCFIATAAYGSRHAPQVETLRQFRDKYLMNNSLGQSFVAIYYKYSPSVSRFIADSSTLKTLTRIILTPFVVFAFLSMKLGLVNVLALMVLSIMAAFALHRRFHHR